MLQIKNTLGGGKPEGLYAWKKYSTLDVFLEKYISTTEQKNNIFPYSPSNVLYKSSSYTFDKNTGIYTLVNPTSVSGSILQDAVHMYNGEYFMLNANSGATMYKAPTGASQESGVTASNSAYNGFSIQTYGNYGRAPYYIYSNKSGTERTFISCIVANDESAYPDGAVHTDGYWYEKITDGLKTLITALNSLLTNSGYNLKGILHEEDITPTGNVTTLPHTYGKTPTAYIVYALSDVTNTTSNYYVQSVMCYVPHPCQMAKYVYSGSNTSTDSSINNYGTSETGIRVRYSTTYMYFKSGVTYRLIVLA